MSKDPKIEAALAEARMRADMAKGKYPVLAAPTTEMDTERPPQPLGTPSPPPYAPGHPLANLDLTPSMPAPSVMPGPPPAPAATSSLQTASFDALLREVDRRKTAAMERLRELDLDVEYLQMEAKLRNLPMVALETLKEIPTAVIEEEISRKKAQ